MTPADRAAAAAAGPSGAQSCFAAGASVSPADRRRHSGAERSPLPIVPRTPTVFSSVACRGGYEPPARPSPLHMPRRQGRFGSPPREAKSGDPGRQARAVVAPSLQPVLRSGQPAAWGPAVFAVLVPRSSFSPFRPRSLPGGGFWSSLRGGEPQSRLMGSCDVRGRADEIVLYQGWGSRPTPFWRGAAGGGRVAVVSYFA